MQKAMRVNKKPQEDDFLNEELIDTRIATKLRKVKDEGDKQNESHE